MGGIRHHAPELAAADDAHSLVADVHCENDSTLNSSSEPFDDASQIRRSQRIVLREKRDGGQELARQRPREDCPQG